MHAHPGSYIFGDVLLSSSRALYSPRWLILKRREKEAHLILAKINQQSQKDECMETYFELEELKEAAAASKASFKEVLQWQYISR